MLVRIRSLYYSEVSSAWLGYELPKLGVAGSNPALRICAKNFLFLQIAISYVLASLRYFRSVLNLSMVLVIKFMHRLKQFSFPINESTYILYLLLKYSIFYILINIKIHICTNYNIKIFYCT